MPYKYMYVLHVLYEMQTCIIILCARVMHCQVLFIALVFADLPSLSPSFHEMMFILVQLIFILVAAKLECQDAPKMHTLRTHAQKR